jgi:hypothetical protein
VGDCGDADPDAPGKVVLLRKCMREIAARIEEQRDRGPR